MGGGSLKRGPPLVKRDLGYRFLPYCKWVGGGLSGLMGGLSGLMFNPLKWVDGSEVVVSAKKFLSKNVKFDVFEIEMTTTFSLGNQRKVYLFVNLSLLCIKYII